MHSCLQVTPVPTLRVQIECHIHQQCRPLGRRPVFGGRCIFMRPLRHVQPVSPSAASRAPLRCIVVTNSSLYPDAGRSPACSFAATVRPLRAARFTRPLGHPEEVLRHLYSAGGWSTVLSSFRGCALSSLGASLDRSLFPLRANGGPQRDDRLRAELGKRRWRWRGSRCAVSSVKHT